MNAPAKAKGDVAMNIPDPESSDRDQIGRADRGQEAASQTAQAGNVAQLRHARQPTRRAAPKPGLDRWFDDQLNRLFNDVSSEPLPPELARLVSELKAQSTDLADREEPSPDELNGNEPDDCDADKS